MISSPPRMSSFIPCICPLRLSSIPYFHVFVSLLNFDDFCHLIFQPMNVVLNIIIPSLDFQHTFKFKTKII